MKVYLIVNEEGKYKIGFTERKTEKRIKELQTGSHSLMTVVQEYETDNARQIETIMHRFMRSKKINGEWFELTNEDVLNFKDKCAQIDTNIKYLAENKI
jgi:predicted GIY-YIG superfamily endonuclease